MSDDEFDLDAMLDEAADDVLAKDEEANDLLDDVLDDVLGAAAPAPAPMQIASPARRAPVVSPGRIRPCIGRPSPSILLGTPYSLTGNDSKKPYLRCSLKQPRLSGLRRSVKTKPAW
jgi:hypothetical protein